MGRRDQGVDQSRGRYHVVPRTLCFITHGTDVLLLKGAPTKRLWPNRYNGVGGHVERNEDIFTAALREMTEETGLAVDDVRLRAVIHIDVDDPQVGILLFVFTARACGRNFRPSSEGTLEWVPQARLLDYELVEDLVDLLPRVLAMGPHDSPLFGRYCYDEDDQLRIEWANTVT
ncbi:MAG: NUDIX domain-containing protein [Anaerolineae bacterium]|nr:NUDIX domain-containing protein [Anaerolineae bacterium]MDW8100226.1 NUDIX domain-containing protein [Anaerolineae bacterium]